MQTSNDRTARFENVLDFLVMVLDGKRCVCYTYVSLALVNAKLTIFFNTNLLDYLAYDKSCHFCALTLHLVQIDEELAKEHHNATTELVCSDVSQLFVT